MIRVSNHQFPFLFNHKKASLLPFWKAVHQVALPTLTELSISFALGAFCCAFSSTASISLIAVSLAYQCITNTATRTAIAYLEVQGIKLPNFVKWITPYRYSKYSSVNIQSFVHESGHAIGAMLLLKDAKPKIELFPYKGGVTRFNINKPSWLGGKVGISNIQPIIAIAGPFFALLVSAIILQVGFSREERNCEFGRILIISALFDFLQHAFYAFSALTASPFEVAHDFVVLWTTAGIHPISATISILAIAFFLFAVQKGNEQLQFHPR